MHQHDLVLAGERHQPLHEREVDAGRGRVVGEREHDDPGLGPRLLPRVHQAVEEGVTRVGRAGPVGSTEGPSSGTWRTSAPAKSGPQMWIGYDGEGTSAVSPGPDQHPHEMREPLLGPDGGDHLGLGVELDAELAQVEVGDGAAQLGDAPGGRVAVVARVVDRLGQLLHRHVGRGQVGVAEAEVDDVVAGSPRASSFRSLMVAKT